MLYRAAQICIEIHCTALNGNDCSAVHCSAVQCSAVQCSLVQISALQRSALQFSAQASEVAIAGLYCGGEQLWWQLWNANRYTRHLFVCVYLDD